MGQPSAIDEAVRQKALEGISRLQAITGYAAFLAVREQNRTFIVDKVPAVSQIDVPGQLWQSAAGRVLAAWTSEEEQGSFLADIQFHGEEETGPPARRRAAGRLSLIRARGYEIDSASDAGMACAAAPVIDGEERAIAAIGMMTPNLSRRNLHELAAALVEQTREATAIAGGALRPNSRSLPPDESVSADLSLLADTANLIGESPVYDARHNRLFWVDMYDPSVYRLDLDRKELTTFFPDEAVLALAALSNGILMATQSGLWLADQDNCMPLRWLGHPEIDKPSNRFNDGKCDTAGRFWVNTMDYNFRPGAGSLYRFEQERGFIVQDSGLSVPNGMGWSPDGRSMYLVDTAERVVYAYDYDDASGNIANRRKFLRVPEDVPGAPDGLTVDRNGTLWIAFFDGWRVGQYGPTGDHLRDIVLPVPRPTSCVIGGPDAATLFITSARIRLGRNLLDTAPFSGGLLAFGKL